MFKPETITHTYLNNVQLTITRNLLSLTVEYKDTIIGKRYLDSFWVLLPSKVFPATFSRYDDRVIMQIVNEAFDGA